MNDLNIYRLERKASKPSHDVMDSCVVIAKDSRQARRIASNFCGDEGKGVWLDSGASWIDKMGVSTNSRALPGLVCRDFNAG